MARRVNTKFLVIFSVVVLGGVASAFVLQGPVKNMIRGDRSKVQIKTADDLVKKSETPGTATLEKKAMLEEAAHNYGLAANSETKNPDLYVKLGDVYSRLAQFDPYGYMQLSHTAWKKALEIDPRYLPALRRLQDSYYKQTESRGAVAASIFSDLEDRASTIHAVDPKDLRAQALMNIAPIKQSLVGIDAPPQKVNAACDELIKLIAENPTAPEIPDMVFHLAAYRVKKGVELKGSSQEKEGNALIFDGIKAFQDAIKRNPESAKLHYKFFNLLAILQSQDRDRDIAQGYTDSLKKELENARKLVTSDDESFVEINLAAYEVGRVSSRDKLTQEAAKKILLNLRDAKPDDQRVRLAVARMWRSDREKRENRDLAIEELEKPMVDSGWVGMEAFMKQDLEIQSWAELCNLYIERYATVAEEKKQQDPVELKRIEETYEKLFTKAHEQANVLKIRGRIELLKGGPDANINAIKTFEKAQQRYKAADSQGREDLDISWELVRAYLRSGLFGSAKQELLKLKDKSPDFIPVRMRLAEVLIREGSNEAARVEVEYMEKQAPDLPEVLRLLLAVLDPTKDAMKVKATFGKLPEATRIDQMMKAQIANLAPVSNPAEAMRLYKMVLAADAADFEALQGAREVLLGQNKKADALSLFEAGQQKKPDDKRIALIIKELKNAPTDELKLDSVELIREQYKNDPFGLELKLYEYYLVISNNDPSKKAEAFTHLQAAEKLQPEDVRVLDLMFQHYLRAQTWDKAAEYVEKLGTKNADQVKGMIYKFRLAMARNDISGAISVANDLTSQYREFARSWVFLGQAQQANKNYDAAIGAYNLALERQSDNTDALAGNIVCYFQTNKPAEALRFIDRGRAAHPGSQFFRNQWMTYHLSPYGNPLLIVPAATEDRDANPNDMNRWVALGRAQYAAGQRRDNKEAAKSIADAKATFNAALGKWPAEMVIWAFLSEIADYTGDAEGGEALLKKMVASKDFIDKSEPSLMLSEHYLRHNDAVKCEATMKEALERFKSLTNPNPGNEIRRKLASYYTQNQKWNEALALLDPASPDMMVRQQIVEIYMLQAASNKNDKELFAKAETMVRSMLTVNPNDAQLHALLGVVQLNMNSPQRAEESLTTALKIDPKNQAALYSRGQLRFKASPPQIDQAIEDLSALRDVNPNHIEGRIALAECLRQRKRFDDAAKELEYALNRAPFRRDIRVTLAGLYAGIKPTPNWNDAERIITDAERIEPKEILWKRMLGKLWSARAVYEKSAQLHEKAAIKIHDALDANPKSGELLSDYLDILEAGKYWPQLNQEVDRVLAADKNLADTGWQIYVKRAVARRNTGNSRESMKDFEKAMQIVEADKKLPQDAMIQIIDKARETMGGGSEIIPRVAQLLASAKGAPATRWKVVLARLYYLDKDYPRAIEYIEQARKESAGLDEKQQIGVLNIAGSIYMTSGDYGMARTAFEQLLNKSSEDLAALNNLAFIVAEHITPPDLTKAMEYSQRAYDLMAKTKMEDPNVLDTVGWVNVLSGGAKLDIGIEYLNRSIAAGEIAEAQYHYGSALMKKNLPEFAKTSFARAKELIIEKEKSDKANVDEALKKNVDDALVNVDKVLNAGGKQ